MQAVCDGWLDVIFSRDGTTFPILAIAPFTQFLFEDIVESVPRLSFHPGLVSAVLEQDKSEAL